MTFDRLRVPQLGIGQPGERFGSGYIESDEESWQKLVGMGLKHVRIVMALPGASEGTVWEMAEVARGHLHKTIFMMPASFGFYDWERHWSDATRLLSSHGVTLPAYDPRGCLFAFGVDGDIARSMTMPKRWTLARGERLMNQLMA